MPVNSSGAGQARCQIAVDHTEVTNHHPVSDTLVAGGASTISTIVDSAVSQTEVVVEGEISIALGAHSRG